MKNYHGTFEKVTSFGRQFLGFFLHGKISFVQLRLHSDHIVKVFGEICCDIKKQNDKHWQYN